ncbi:MAG: hypothetical protein B6D55_04820, partial [Candidatus Omnitrophica bacterium 4484_70.2]
LLSQGDVYFMDANTLYDFLSDAEPFIAAATMVVGLGEISAAARVLGLRVASVTGRSALTAEEIAETTAVIRASTIGARIGLPAIVRTAATWSAINVGSDIGYAVISGEKLPSQGDLAVSQIIGFGEGLVFHGLLQIAGYTAGILKGSERTARVTEPFINWANSEKLSGRIFGWPVRAIQDRVVPALIEYNRFPAQITLDSSEGALSFVAVGPTFAGIKAGLWDSLIVPLLNKELPHWAGITGPKGERDLSWRGQFQALALHAVDSPKFGRWFAPFIKVFQLPSSAVRDVPLIGEPLYACSTDIGIVGWSRIIARRLLGQSWKRIAEDNIARGGGKFVLLNPDSLAFFAVYTSGVDTLLEKTGIAPSSDVGMILGQLAFILIPSYSGSMRDRVVFSLREMARNTKEDIGIEPSSLRIEGERIVALDSSGKKYEVYPLGLMDNGEIRIEGMKIHEVNDGGKDKIIVYGVEEKLIEGIEGRSTWLIKEEVVREYDGRGEYDNRYAAYVAYKGGKPITEATGEIGRDIQMYLLGEKLRSKRDEEIDRIIRSDNPHSLLSGERFDKLGNEDIKEVASKERVGRVKDTGELINITYKFNEPNSQMFAAQKLRLHLEKDGNLRERFIEGMNNCVKNDSSQAQQAMRILRESGISREEVIETEAFKAFSEDVINRANLKEEIQKENLRKMLRNSPWGLLSSTFQQENLPKEIREIVNVVSASWNKIEINKEGKVTNWSEVGNQLSGDLRDLIQERIIDFRNSLEKGKEFKPEEMKKQISSLIFSSLKLMVENEGKLVIPNTEGLTGKTSFGIPVIVEIFARNGRKVVILNPTEQLSSQAFGKMANLVKAKIVDKGYGEEFTFRNRVRVRFLKEANSVSLKNIENFVKEAEILFIDLGAIQNLRLIAKNTLKTEDGRRERVVNEIIEDIYRHDLTIIDEIQKMVSAPTFIVGFGGEKIAEGLQKKITEKMRIVVEVLKNIAKGEDFEGFTKEFVDKLVNNDVGYAEWSGKPWDEGSFLMPTPKFVNEFFKDKGVDSELKKCINAVFEVLGRQPGRDFGEKIKEDVGEVIFPCHGGYLNEQMSFTGFWRASAYQVIGRLRIESERKNGEFDKLAERLVNKNDSTLKEELGKVRVSEKSLQAQAIEVLGEFNSPYRIAFTATPQAAIGLKEVMPVVIEGWEMKSIEGIVEKMWNNLRREIVRREIEGKNIEVKGFSDLGKIKIDGINEDIVVIVPVENFPFVRIEKFALEIGRNRDDVLKMVAEEGVNDKFVSLKTGKEFSKDEVINRAEEGERLVIVYNRPHYTGIDNFLPANKEQRWSIIGDETTNLTKLSQGLRRPRDIGKIEIWMLGKNLLGENKENNDIDIEKLGGILKENEIKNLYDLKIKTIHEAFKVTFDQIFKEIKGVARTPQEEKAANEMHKEFYSQVRENENIVSLRDTTAEEVFRGELSRILNEALRVCSKDYSYYDRLNSRQKGIVDREIIGKLAEAKIEFGGNDKEFSYILRDTFTLTRLHPEDFLDVIKKRYSSDELSEWRISTQRVSESSFEAAAVKTMEILTDRMETITFREVNEKLRRYLAEEGFSPRDINLGIKGVSSLLFSYQDEKQKQIERSIFKSQRSISDLGRNNWENVYGKNSQLTDFGKSVALAYRAINTYQAVNSLGREIEQELTPFEVIVAAVVNMEDSPQKVEALETLGSIISFNPGSVNAYPYWTALRALSLMEKKTLEKIEEVINEKTVEAIKNEKENEVSEKAAVGIKGVSVVITKLLKEEVNFLLFRKGVEVNIDSKISSYEKRGENVQVIKSLAMIKELFDEGIESFGENNLGAIEGWNGLNENKDNIFEVAEFLVKHEINPQVLKTVNEWASALGIKINVQDLSGVDASYSSALRFLNKGKNLVDNPQTKDFYGRSYEELKKAYVDFYRNSYAERNENKLFDINKELKKKMPPLKLMIKIGEEAKWDGNKIYTLVAPFRPVYSLSTPQLILDVLSGVAKERKVGLSSLIKNDVRVDDLYLITPKDSEKVAKLLRKASKSVSSGSAKINKGEIEEYLKGSIEEELENLSQEDMNQEGIKINIDIDELGFDDENMFKLVKELYTHPLVKFAYSKGDRDFLLKSLMAIEVSQYGYHPQVYSFTQVFDKFGAPTLGCVMYSLLNYAGLRMNNVDEGEIVTVRLESKDKDYSHVVSGVKEGNEITFYDSTPLGTKRGVIVKINLVDDLEVKDRNKKIYSLKKEGRFLNTGNPYFDTYDTMRIISEGEGVKGIVAAVLGNQAIEEKRLDYAKAALFLDSHYHQAEGIYKGVLEGIKGLLINSELTPQEKAKDILSFVEKYIQDDELSEAKTLYNLVEAIKSNNKEGIRASLVNFAEYIDAQNAEEIASEMIENFQPTVTIGERRIPVSEINPQVNIKDVENFIKGNRINSEGVEEIKVVDGSDRALISREDGILYIHPLAFNCFVQAAAKLDGNSWQEIAQTIIAEGDRNVGRVFPLSIGLKALSRLDRNIKVFANSG